MNTAHETTTTQILWAIESAGEYEFAFAFTCPDCRNAWLAVAPQGREHRVATPDHPVISEILAGAEDSRRTHQTIPYTRARTLAGDTETELALAAQWIGYVESVQSLDQYCPRHARSCPLNSRQG